MKAKVVKPFAGVPDGAVYPRNFAIGDELEGELAKVAIANDWATELAAELELAPAPSPKPKRRRSK